MTSTAISAQGTVLKISGATGAAKNISGVQLTNPVVITSTAHGLNKGDVVSIAGVVGTTQLNGLTAVVEYVTANTVALSGVDASAMTAYTSGGTLTPVTWLTIGNLINFKGFDGQANELDSTTLSSTAKEFMLGLQDFGHFTFDVFRDYSDVGQQAMDAAKQAGSAKSFQLALPNGKVATFTGFVKNSPLDGAVDQLLKTTGVSIRISGPVTVA